MDQKLQDLEKQFNGLNTSIQLQTIDIRNQNAELVKRVFELEKTSDQQSEAYKDSLTQIKTLLEIIKNLKEDLNKLSDEFQATEVKKDAEKGTDLISVIKRLFKR